MKILAGPHLLPHLWTWLGKLGSSCSEACPEAPPCPSPLSFSVDYKCIPDPQTCSTRRRVNPGEHQEHKSRCDDPPSDRERKPASGCFRRGLCSQNSEDQSLSLEHRFRGAAPGGSSREHCCDHLVAQKLGSWRSLALAGRFGVGWERCQGKAAGGGPRSRSAEWSETRQEDGASQHGVQVGLEPYRHAWSHDMQGQGHLPQTPVCLLLSKRLISTMINRSREMERKRGNKQEQ